MARAARQQPEAALAHLQRAHAIDDRVGEELEIGQEIHVVDQGAALQTRLADVVDRDDVDDAVRQEEGHHGQEQHRRRDERLPLAPDVLAEAELR